MRRRLWTLVLLIFAPIVALTIAALWQPEPKPLKPGPTAENFRRLREGMAWEEVIAILGEPDGFELSVKYKQDRLIWRGGDCRIHLDTNQGVMLEGRCYPAKGPAFDLAVGEPKSWWQRLRDLLPF